MALYIAREASKWMQLRRRVSMEMSVEAQVLLEKWKLLLAGLVFQVLGIITLRKFKTWMLLTLHEAIQVAFVHIFTDWLLEESTIYINLDQLSKELGKERGYVSESLFSFTFLGFVLWTLHPFFCHSKWYYTVLIWHRTSQALRTFTFYATQLPGPNYHCREGSKLARLPLPDSVLEVLLINFPHGVIYACGDLKFSSHMIFTLVFVITYQKYGSKRYRYGLFLNNEYDRASLIGVIYMLWNVMLTLSIIQSLLIIASRKNYTVDVFVAWYTVNLEVFFVDKKLPEMPDRTTGSLTLLPMSVKENDGRSEEEVHKLLSRNSVDTTDWRQNSNEWESHR